MCRSGTGGRGRLAASHPHPRPDRRPARLPTSSRISRAPPLRLRASTPSWSEPNPCEPSHLFSFDLTLAGCVQAAKRGGSAGSSRPFSAGVDGGAGQPEPLETIMSQVDGREPVRSASALGVRSQPLALLLLLCGGLLNGWWPQVSSQDELGERAQRTAAVRPPATSSPSERRSLVAESHQLRLRVADGAKRAAAGLVWAGVHGASGASATVSGSGGAEKRRWFAPPSSKLPGILEENHETEWMWVGCRGADAGGSGGAEGPSGRGCVRAAQAAQCGRPEHAAAAAYAALSVCCCETLLQMFTRRIYFSGIPAPPPQRHASAARAAVSAHEQGRLRSQTSDAALRQKIFE